MQPAKALAAVKSHIQGIIVRDNHSLTLVRIFEAQVHQSLSRLRTEFMIAREHGEQRMIWPRMVKDYVCGDDDEPCPVWGPIKDKDGRILGLRVTPRTSPDDKTKPRKPRKLVIDLEWHMPEPD
jgi:hypothetical protein